MKGEIFTYLVTGLGCVSGTAQRTYRTGRSALRHVARWRQAERRHEALGQHEHGAALADPRSNLRNGGGQIARRDRETDEVHAAELDVSHGGHLHLVGQLHPRKTVVLAPFLDALGACLGAASELHLDSRAREESGERCAHRAGADDRGLAQRRQSAEPLPLEFDARPDAGGHLSGKPRRRVLHAREGERAAETDLHLGGTDLPAAAGILAACDGDRHHRHAGLKRQPADAALGLAERALPDARALGEDEHHLAALEQQTGSLHRLLVGLATPHGEGAERVQNPGLPARLEELLLGHEVRGPPDADSDHERVEEAAVVRRQQNAALAGAVLASDARDAEVDEHQRLQNGAHGPIHERVHATSACALVIDREIARRSPGRHQSNYSPERRWLHMARSAR